MNYPQALVLCAAIAAGALLSTRLAVSDSPPAGGGASADGPAGSYMGVRADDTWVWVVDTRSGAVKKCVGASPGNPEPYRERAWCQDWSSVP